MLRATFQTGVQDLRQQTSKHSLLDDAKGLLNLREELAAEERRLSDRRLDLARRYLAGPERQRMPVPAEEFASWFNETDETARDDSSPAEDDS